MFLTFNSVLINMLISMLIGKPVRIIVHICFDYAPSNEQLKTKNNSHWLEYDYGNCFYGNEFGW